jgi:DNA-binding NarL/FixJ family response regulator
LIRVAVIAPNPALRVGLRGILGTDPELSVLGEAGSFDELDAAAPGADVLVLASLHDLDFHALAAEAAFLLLTDHPEEARSAVRNGARAWGILPLNASEEEILIAVRALGEGLWVGAPAMVREIFRQQPMVELSANEALIEPVTQREMDVLQSIARGLSNKQIALALGISEHTVKFHLSSLYAKLGATNRTEAVRIGMQQGLIVL